MPLSKDQLLTALGEIRKPETKREFNQSEILARQMSRILNIPVLSDNLTRVRNCAPQTKLSGQERLKNIKDAFGVKDANILRGKKILVIDDVFTTGATADECAKSLKKSGASKVEVLALAKGI